MALKGYGVLAGQVSDSRAEGGADSPHFQIRVRGRGTDFRVAVNVLSQESPSELLFVADESFSHPLLQALPDLADGFTAVPNQAGGVALDPAGPAPERETVTLINAGAQDLDLTGWALADRLGQRMPLDPATLPAGETVRIVLRPPVQRGDRGGLVTLLDPAGLKADGVAYTQGQASAEGQSIVF
jgi:Uncharacterized conserved protein (DUF2278)